MAVQLNHRSVFCWLIAITLAFTLVSPSSAKDSWSGVARVVVLGDIHGDYDQYRAAMEMAGLLDQRGRWIAGNTHLVQLGDIPDRGPDTVKIFRELNALQKKAKTAGGYVHLLIGNHEAMNIQGDLRYVTPGEYAALVDRQSQHRQNDYYKRFIASLPEDTVVDDAFRQQWLKDYPLGYVEHRLLWQPGGDFARIVARRNTVIRINRTLFVHGGLNPHNPPLSLRKINRTVAQELRAPMVAEDGLAVAEGGPLWYRGLAMNDKATELPALLEMFAHYDVDRIVIGHTPTRGFVRPRFDGRVILADVGLSAHYGGGLAAVLIEGGAVYALHRGERVMIPDNDTDRLSYYQRIAELEPNPAAVNQLIRKLSLQSTLPESP